MSFDVTSSFLPHLAWVKPSVILDERQSTASLQHERTHFDVSELSARTLRQTLRTLERPCALSTSELNTIVTRVLADDARTQERYDRETVHGSNRRIQAQWDASVRAELARTVAHAGR